MPFQCVATDVIGAREVWFASGPADRADPGVGGAARDLPGGGDRRRPLPRRRHRRRRAGGPGRRARRPDACTSAGRRLLPAPARAPAAARRRGPGVLDRPATTGFKRDLAALPARGRPAPPADRRDADDAVQRLHPVGRADLPPTRRPATTWPGRPASPRARRPATRRPRASPSRPGPGVPRRRQNGGDDRSPRQPVHRRPARDRARPRAGGALAALDEALAVTVDEQRRGRRGRRPLAPVPRRLGPAGAARPRRRRVLRLQPGRLPPRPRPAAGQRLAGLGLRPLAPRENRGFLRALDGLRASAEAIGERDEAERVRASSASSTRSGRRLRVDVAAFPRSWRRWPLLLVRLQQAHDLGDAHRPLLGRRRVASIHRRYALRSGPASRVRARLWRGGQGPGDVGRQVGALGSLRGEDGVDDRGRWRAGRPGTRLGPRTRTGPSGVVSITPRSPRPPRLPVTWWWGLAPHASSGSNGTGTRAAALRSTATVTAKRRARSPCREERPSPRSWPMAPPGDAACERSGPDRPLVGVTERGVVPDDEALRSVFEAEHERLWRSLLAYAGDADVASDAAAEAFAQALRRGDGLRDPAAWVWRAAFRIAAGLLAARRREGGPVPDGAGAGADTHPDDVAALLDALAARPDRPARGGAGAGGRAVGGRGRGCGGRLARRRAGPAAPGPPPAAGHARRRGGDRAGTPGRDR